MKYLIILYGIVNLIALIIVIIKTIKPEKRSNNMADGIGCKCEARSDDECVCDNVDWETQELIDLRKENEELKEWNTAWKESHAILQKQNGELRGRVKELEENEEAIAEDVHILDMEVIKYKKALEDVLEAFLRANEDGIITDTVWVNDFCTLVECIEVALKETK